MVEILTDNWAFLLSGVATTVGLTIVGFLGSLIVGTVAAIFRVSPIVPLRAVGTAYVEFFRNIPLLSLLVLVTFGLPDIGVLLPLFWCGAVSLILSGSAFVCETVRSGINTIAIGQSEASRALGMSFTQQLRLVILPQAFRTMVQPLVTVFIGIFLSSSLAGVVGVMDLTATVSYINNREALGLVTFMVAAVMYLTISLVAGVVGDRLERRLRVLR